MSCPGCGAQEATYHARGCELRPVAVRPCCRTLLWRDGSGEHEAWCSEWGTSTWSVGRALMYAPLTEGREWYDVRWSHE